MPLSRNPSYAFVQPFVALPAGRLRGYKKKELTPKT